MKRRKGVVTFMKRQCAWDLDVERNDRWVEHMPDMKPYTMIPTIYAEADCPCGVEERHTHCPHCGGLLTKGDWDKKGKTIAVIRL